MTWKLATLGQLYQIAYGDEPSTPLDRRQAAEEIRRRQKARHGRKQYREKKGYG